MLGVRLPSDLERRLEVLAEKTKRPKSFYVKEAIAEYLDEYEGIYEAVAAYEEEKKKGTLVTYTFEEVLQKCGLNATDLDTED